VTEPVTEAAPLSLNVGSAKLALTYLASNPDSC